MADLGCGSGFYTFALADCVGLEGKVYAVDSDETAVHAVKHKADKLNYTNIEAHVTSAHNVAFIDDDAVDFVLADGLLCCMAPRHHTSAMNEIRRILKPSGHAYLSVGKGFSSYVSQGTWKNLLEKFSVKRKSDGLPVIGDRWVEVTKQQ